MPRANNDNYITADKHYPDGEPDISGKHLDPRRLEAGDDVDDEFDNEDGEYGWDEPTPLDDLIRNGWIAA